MSPAYKSVPVAPAVKGINASTDYATQPKGSYPRLSNLLMSKRGALDTCDGTQIVHAFNGQVQTGRGRIMEPFLFSPTGVANYYLALGKALDKPLGGPQNLTAVLAAGGTLTSGQQYFYSVTAVDGAGGETNAPGRVSATPSGGNLSVTLTWNIVPNAVGYNVYRSTTLGGPDKLLVGTGLPVSQPSFGALTVSYTDNGAASTPTYSLASAKATTSGGLISYTFKTTTPNGYLANQFVAISGCSPPLFNVTAQIQGIIDSFTFTIVVAGSFIATASVLGTVTSAAVPVIDSTQQTALFKMPVIAGSPATLPVAYGNGQIAALFPADFFLAPAQGGGGGGGGSGGGGGTGGGGSTGGGGTPSGGILGNISLIPQMVQFTNRVAIALGNGFPPQLYSDVSGTTINPATNAAISSISVDAFGVVTVTTSSPHGIVAAQVGGNVIIGGVANSLYNFVGPTIQIVSPTQYKVRNLAVAGQAASSGGFSFTTALPIYSTFVPAFPAWSATTAFATGSIIQPTIANGHFYKAVQGGTSGGSQPTFPTVTGQQVSDGSVIWQEAGLTNTAAPPPPGAAHVTVYAGSLWWWNTSTTNTSTGLDGPCSLRMSDVNQPNSYNPLNQAFLDKDDGAEGMGLQAFTITAQGIPPQGSLVAFKNFASYQIVGVFGSTNLAIQRVKSSMGNLAPRSLQFVTGFGLIRFTHLGFANFDGVEDRVISEDIRPYLFPSNDSTDSDIIVLDANWQAVMWGFQSAQPAQYCAAIPIGNSSGQLTRILVFDMVLKAWTTVDLPWAISSAAQFVSTGANSVTILGGYSDGLLSRWQAGDAEWDVGATGARSPSFINWSEKLPEAVSQDLSQKMNCRRVAIRGVSSGSGNNVITVIPVVNGKNKPAQSYPIPASGDWEVFASFMYDGQRFSAIISGSGQVELNRPAYHIGPKEVGAARVVA